MTFQVAEIRDYQMVYQSLESAGAVHSHGVQEKHLFMKERYCPNVPQAQEQTQFQHLRCLVAEM